MNTSWSLYDYFFSTVFYCTGSVALVCNVTLIYLIITRSPKTLAAYRVFLLNVALGDIVFTLSGTFAQIRIIPNKWAFAYIPLGPSRFFGPHISYLAYCVQLHSLFYSFLSFPLSFGFRYYILIRPMPTVSSCVLLCLCLWMVALGQHILFIFSESPTSVIEESLLINKPHYNLTGWQISGNHMLNQPMTSVVLGTIVLPMFPIYVLVIFFYKKVHKFLKANNENMREVTVRGHKKLLKAITIQASIPIFFMFPPITIYGLYHLEFIDFTIIEYSVYALFSFFPAISPMVTLYFVKPYNLAIRRFFRLQERISPFTSETDKHARYSTSQI
ncbi:unnamed protein product [Auanema sp. JU1783]|nr:unnamed protein product [Auanema sp. JU1783]